MDSSEVAYWEGQHSVALELLDLVYDGMDCKISTQLRTKLDGLHPDLLKRVLGSDKELCPLGVRDTTYFLEDLKNFNNPRYRRMPRGLKEALLGQGAISVSESRLRVSGHTAIVFNMTVKAHMFQDNYPVNMRSSIPGSRMWELTHIAQEDLPRMIILCTNGSSADKRLIYEMMLHGRWSPPHIRSGS